MDMKDGINHFGDFIRKIRERQGLSQADLARLASVDRTRVNDLENHGEIGIALNTISAIVKALGLDQNDQKLLRQTLYPGAQEVAEREWHLSQFRFTTLQDENNPTCRTALDSLRATTYPAFLRDDLLFCYVYNQSLLDFFEITENDLKGSDWTGWHIIGAKYAPGSKVAVAHGWKGEMYFPQVLKYYFEETARFFFTAQMQALRNRLWPLSKAYRDWWSSIIRFDAPFQKLKRLPREILYDGQWISMEVSDGEEFPVELNDGYTLKYRKVVWKPVDSDAKQVIQKISKSYREQNLYFAADYIKQEYNDWPEVRQESKNPPCIPVHL